MFAFQQPPVKLVDPGFAQQKRRKKLRYQRNPAFRETLKFSGFVVVAPRFRSVLRFGLIRLANRPIRCKVIPFTRDAKSRSTGWM
jgi:hypothetical protein